MNDWKSGSVSLVSFSVIALVTKESFGLKASENLPGVGIKLCVKYKVNAYRNMSVMPGQTLQQTN